MWILTSHTCWKQGCPETVRDTDNFCARCGIKQPAFFLRKFFSEIVQTAEVVQLLREVCYSDLFTRVAVAYTNYRHLMRTLEFLRIVEQTSKQGESQRYFRYVYTYSKEELKENLRDLQAKLQHAEV
jgi:hypothetical protein